MSLPFFITLVLSAATAGATAQETARVRPWTILFYGGTDSSAEESVVGDLAMLNEALAQVPALEAIVLLDRAPAYASGPGCFGEDFEGTRLYRLQGGRAERLGMSDRRRL